MIYFLKSGNRIKIGYSDNVYERIMQLQTGSADILKATAVMEGSFQTETGLHRMFSHLRTSNGEWFKENDELRYFIRVVRNMPLCNNILTLQKEALKLLLSEKALRLSEKGNVKLLNRIIKKDSEYIKDIARKNKNLKKKRQRKLKKKLKNLVTSF